MKSLKQSNFGAALCVLALALPCAAAPVDGFRSARFGQAEADVVQAISRDFSVGDKDIQHAQDPAARVTILSIQRNALEPLGLPATLKYVIGYKCHCLIEVSVEWTFPQNTSADQRNNAAAGISALVSHFQDKGWGKDEAQLNRLSALSKNGTEGTIIFFQGQNPQGGSIMLVGTPVSIAKDSADPQGNHVAIDAMQTVAVIYQLNAKEPDVYRADTSGF